MPICEANDRRVEARGRGRQGPRADGRLQPPVPDEGRPDGHASRPRKPGHRRAGRAGGPRGRCDRRLGREGSRIACSAASSTSPATPRRAPAGSRPITSTTWRRRSRATTARNASWCSWPVPRATSPRWITAVRHTYPDGDRWAQLVGRQGRGRGPQGPPHDGARHADPGRRTDASLGDPASASVAGSRARRAWRSSSGDKPSGRPDDLDLRQGDRAARRPDQEESERSRSRSRPCRSGRRSS